MKLHLISMLLKKIKKHFFTKLRKEGLKKRNISEAVKPNPQFQPLKICKGEVVHCQLCGGCYSTAYLYTHQQKCQDDSITKPKYIMTSLALTSENKLDEFQELLSTLHRDDAGKVCLEDKTILLIGRRLF